MARAGIGRTAGILVAIALGAFPSMAVLIACDEGDDDDNDASDDDDAIECVCEYRCEGDTRDRTLDASSSSQCEYRADQACRFDHELDFWWSDFDCL